MRSLLRRSWLLCFIVVASLAAQEDTMRPKLNHLQMKGTHNSYHIAFPPLSWTALGYTHVPLKQQFEEQGVRQIELDIHQCSGGEFCVYHIGFIDSRSSCPNLRACLSEVRDWSGKNPKHHPIFIFLEPKDSAYQSRKWEYFQNVEDQILSVFKRENMLIPDDIRRKHFTLKQAVEKDGWPTIDELRGKVVFVLLDEGGHRDHYTLDAPGLQKRLMFTTSNARREDAAIIKMDNPLTKKEEIEKLVKRGFIVRTRADEDLKEPAVNDSSRLRAALESGAQIISTDVPVKTDSYEYFVDLEGGTPSRCNPVTALSTCKAQDL